MNFMQCFTILGRLFILDTMVTLAYYGIYAVLYAFYGSHVFLHDHTSIKIIEAVVMLIVSNRLFDHCLNHHYRWPEKFSVLCENASILKFIGFQLLSFLAVILFFATFCFTGIINIQDLACAWQSYPIPLTIASGFLFLCFSFILSTPVFLGLSRINFYILKIR